MSETLHNTPSTARIDANEIVASVVDLPEFQRSREAGYNLTRSIARAALEQTGMRLGVDPTIEDNLELDLEDASGEDTFEPDLENASIETIRYALVGELPSFVHGLEGIRAYHEDDAINREAYISMKGRASRFNHTIKSMIERDTTLNFSSVTQTVTTLYGVMNRERWADDRAGYEREAKTFASNFDARLRGMQQEVLASQIIETINSVDPIVDPETKQKHPRVAIDTNVSVEDDLHGVDMYITLDGVTFPIDIKASERTVQNARKRSRHPKSIVTTGITSNDLQGAFRVNTKRARKTAPAMLTKLYAARDEYIAQHADVTQTHQLAA